MGGTPKSSILVGSSIIIHFGVPKKKYETPIYIYIYQTQLLVYHHFGKTPYGHGDSPYVSR